MRSIWSVVAAESVTWATVQRYPSANAEAHGVEVCDCMDLAGTGKNAVSGSQPLTAPPMRAVSFPLNAVVATKAPAVRSQWLHWSSQMANPGPMHRMNPGVALRFTVLSVVKPKRLPMRPFLRMRAFCRYDNEGSGST